MSANREEWRDVIGYEGWYQVSDHGRIKRIKSSNGTRAGKILCPKRDGDGYLFVALSRNGTARQVKVHRIVMRSFIGEPFGLQVNHKNGIREDNRLSNLEYVTAKENVQHSINVLGSNRLGEGNPNSALSDEQVIEIMRLINSEMYTQEEIGKRFGVSQITISRISTGKSWGHLSVRARTE